MNISRLSRLAAVGAVTFTAIAASTVPASAHSDKIVYLPNGRGYMKFYDNGDVFEVCDTKADGHGVTGQLWAKNQITQNGSTVFTLKDGGDKGCDKKAYDIGKLHTYSMQVEWDGDRVWHFSEWFNE
ncbi:hypothetical protein [Streptomyces murinus]|uniref:hypothetical protein n=1 Tax=Streptomyces murinus TaxID=33900 RepID=UPI00372AD2CD